MQFTTAFFALVPLVAALPSALGLAVRTPGNVLSCSEAGFQADCERILSTFSGECIQYDSGLSKQLSAFGPDSGQTCFLFAGDGCTGAVSGAIVFPGVSNLQAINFNDEATSYKCFF
ncbi:hypothetical protein B0H19DRAFT_1081082 [Mycena capillaripes]|nr:hypothetical protein B0H19DRAFT_1081082 [Mycena capillaripes]